MRFDVHFLKGALPECEIIEDTFPEEVQFSIDTRTLRKGDIFIALPGVNCDGHDFLAQAVAKGAAGLFIAQDKKITLEEIKKQIKNKLVVAVANPMQALLRLAASWRAQFNYPIVAITGSVGKTSTKEIIANILTAHGSNFLVSHGNQNTLIGLSLNMLRMRSHHQVAIFEVGISKRGEMGRLAHQLKPTTALITNVYHSHMEGLGSLTDIALEKRDIFKYFDEDSIGIVNGDQPILAHVGYNHPVVKFGAKTINQIQARKVNLDGNHSSFVLKIYKEKHRILLKQMHEGTVFNSLAAAAVAYLLKIPATTIVQGIQKPFVITGRYEQRSLKKWKGTLIDDCYNANPESMKAALLAFQKIDTKAQKIAVLGDMLELGVGSPFWHRQLGRFLSKVPSLTQVILVGEQVQWTHAELLKRTIPIGLRAQVVPNWKEAAEKLREHLSDEVVILVKGSHAMGLENLVAEFT